MNTIQNVSHQQGASLVVAMVIVLIMTLMGASAMRSSVSELKMSNRAQQQSEAMNAAEETLMAAEMDLVAMNAGTVANKFGTTGYYRSTDNAGLQTDVRLTDWAAASQGSVANGYHAWVNEYLGERPADGEKLNTDSGGPVVGDKVHIYQLSARGVGPQNSVRMVQSIYLTEVGQ